MEHSLAAPLIKSVKNGCYDRTRTLADNNLLGPLPPTAGEGLDGPSVQANPLVEGVLQLQFRALCPEDNIALRVRHGVADEHRGRSCGDSHQALS